MVISITQHNEEIQRNLECWAKKPLLRRIYQDFHRQIARYINRDVEGLIVELGSGIGNIKEVIPDCLRTDIFPNPWIDHTENAYCLSFPDNSLSHLILFDVFHHLRYPGTALREFDRVLRAHGRVIIFDPFLSILGLFIFGLFHHESIGLCDQIDWFAPDDWSPDKDTYYAAQGNATRIFHCKGYQKYLADWTTITKHRLSAISYVASGGYSKRQIYPDFLFPVMTGIDKACDSLPCLFATRLLVVLEKKTIRCD